MGWDNFSLRADFHSAFYTHRHSLNGAFGVAVWALLFPDRGYMKSLKAPVKNPKRGTDKQELEHQTFPETAKH